MLPTSRYSVLCENSQKSPEQSRAITLLGSTESPNSQLTDISQISSPNGSQELERDQSFEVSSSAKTSLLSIDSSSSSSSSSRKDKLKKRVSFFQDVLVTSIETRDDYIREGLDNDMWLSKKELKEYAKDFDKAFAKYLAQAEIRIPYEEVKRTFILSGGESDANHTTLSMGST